MIEAMPRPRPPYLNREVTRHGRVVWFVRVYPGLDPVFASAPRSARWNLKANTNPRSPANLARPPKGLPLPAL